jgi:ATP-binding cassette subfamily B protein
VNNLSFEYVPKIPVLRDVTFSIERGAKIGIVGTTGSGKSTLMDVLMGLLHPTAGEILIDGIGLNRDNILGWQKNIAHVPQSIFLTDSSIAENIAFGVNSSEIDYKLVSAVSKTSQLDVLIDSWPDKYMTLVGERGVRLSGGQRQRIGIARALYKKAKFIIFDEATSALDGKTEIAVMDAINSLEKDLTILIVAHRLSTLKYCDLIIKIENGLIVEIGSFEKIINLG